jgi:hypothetical protein
MIGIDRPLTDPALANSEDPMVHDPILRSLEVYRTAIDHRNTFATSKSTVPRMKSPDIGMWRQSEDGSVSPIERATVSRLPVSGQASWRWRPGPVLDPVPTCSREFSRGGAQLCRRIVPGMPRKELPGGEEVNCWSFKRLFRSHQEIWYLIEVVERRMKH